MPANTVIKLRRGTASEWTTANSVLAAGEMGIETDTNKFKFGNGATAWSTLPYASADSSGGGGETGPAGAGYDFPQRVADPGDPPIPPPAPMPYPPTYPETIDMYSYTYSTFGLVGAYRVGDLIRYSSISSPQNYLFGRITSLDNVGEYNEGLTFVITSYNENVGLPSISDYTDQALSLAGAEGDGYSLKQAVPGPMDYPDNNPLGPDNWEDLVAGDSSFQVRGIAGAYKVNDYVQVSNPWENLGAFIKGYITGISNYGLNDFIEIVVDAWDSDGAAPDTALDVTPGYVKMSIAGTPAAGGGASIVLQSLYSRPSINISEYFSAGYSNGWGNSDYTDAIYNGTFLGSITKQEASSCISIDFILDVTVVANYGVI